MNMGGETRKFANERLLTFLRGNNTNVASAYH
jgi:hypothetical protein